MSDELQTGTQYETLRNLLAERAADAAREVQEDRRMLRQDPEFVDAKWWLSEDRGERNELAKALARLQTRYGRGEFDPLEFAEWLWRRHTSTNKEQSELTGRAQRSASGAHHGSYLALKMVRIATDVEHGDYGDPEVAV